MKGFGGVLGEKEMRAELGEFGVGIEVGMGGEECESVGSGH